MKEQKFSALDSFVQKGYEITFWMWGKYKIDIWKDNTRIWQEENFETADDAMTAALRYLRKINKPKPK